MEAPAINQDLARWSKHHWFWLVFFLFVLQCAGLVYVTRPLPVRGIYPAEPVVGIGSGGGEISSEWLDLQNPMLFASAGWKGVSALAWMQKPEMPVAIGREFPPIEYLKAGQVSGQAAESPSIPLAIHTRAAPSMTLPVAPAPERARKSELSVEGFGERKPVSTPNLPVQLHNDVVARTVVEAGIDPEGAVISARVVTPSGSKRADNDALAISRQMQFTPVAGVRTNPEIAWGKLIFEWHALHLSSTNTVGR